jgi:hypothetical protein
LTDLKPVPERRHDPEMANFVYKGFSNPNWRFSVTGSRGTRDGKSFAVWDAQQRTVVSWHKTFKAAQAAAKKLNRAE